MTDYQQFSYGGSTYPLTSSTAASLLFDADPALFYTIDYFQSVLNTHISARLVAQAAVAPAAPIPAAVANVVPYDPVPYLTQSQFQFPLLAVYRVSEEYEDRTVTWPHRVGEWVVQYILPPLTAGQMERIGPILATAGEVLQGRIENMFDPSYQSGLQVWKAANIERIKLIKGSFGRWEAAGNLAFPVWTGRLQVSERLMPNVTGMDVLSGLDASLDLPDIQDVVDVAVSFNDPTKIQGLTGLFLDTFATSGSNITQWTDLSGRGNHLPGQSTEGGFPTITNAFLNGHAVSTHSPQGSGPNNASTHAGPQTYLAPSLAAYISEGGHQIYALVRLIDLSSFTPATGDASLWQTRDSWIADDRGRGVQVGLRGSTTGAVTSALSYATGKLSAGAPNDTGSSGSGVESIQIAPAASAMGAWVLTTLQRGNGFTGLRIGTGPFIRTPSTGPFLTTYNPKLRVGAATGILGGSATIGMHGYIAALAFFNRALTDAEDAAMINEFQTYSGLKF